MEKITRRAALAAIPACGLAPIVPAMAELVDPMLEAIKDYRAGYAAFMAIPSEQITGDNEDALVAATYGPPQSAILLNAPHTPKVTSIAGVREAIRLTFEENALIDCLAENALREALAYLDREAQS